MRLIRVLMLLLALGAVPAAALAAQPQPPKEFVPVDTIPADEQIPAINLVATAYGFVWVGLLGYVWSLARRLKTVESELRDLESRKR